MQSHETRAFRRETSGKLLVYAETVIQALEHASLSNKDGSRLQTAATEQDCNRIGSHGPMEESDGLRADARRGTITVTCVVVGIQALQHLKLSPLADGIVKCDAWSLARVLASWHAEVKRVQCQEIPAKRFETAP